MSAMRVNSGNDPAVVGRFRMAEREPPAAAGPVGPPSSQPSPRRLGTEVREWPAPWLRRPISALSRDELAQALSVLTRFFPEDAALTLALRREQDACTVPVGTRDETWVFFE